MLAGIDNGASQDPASEAARYKDVRARDAQRPKRRAVSPQETARRRAQMKEQGDIVAERHRQLRQGAR